jgi:hypothetical protein
MGGTILGFELRASYLVGSCYYLSHIKKLEVFWLLVIFQIGSHIFSWNQSRLWFCYLWLSYSWNDSCAPPSPSYLLRWGLANFLSRQASNCATLELHIPSSCSYRHEPLCLVLMSEITFQNNVHFLKSCHLLYEFLKFWIILLFCFISVS